MIQGNFDDILDECLERLRRGEGVEECLASHPEHASELEPLLRASLALIQEIPGPPAEARRAAHLRFQGAVRARLRERPGRTWTWWPAPVQAFTSLAVALVLTFSVGGGAILASSDATPDDPLYPIKRTAERLRLAFTLSEMGRANLHLQWAERRAQELAEMAEAGTSENIEQLGLDIVREIEIAQAEAGFQGETVTTAAASMMTLETAAAPAEAAAEDSRMMASEAVSSAADRAMDASLDSPASSSLLEDEDLRSFYEAVQGQGFRYLALLQLLRHRTPPEARSALERALEHLQRRYYEVLPLSSAPPPDPLESLVMVRGKAERLDGAWRVGGLQIEMDPDALRSVSLRRDMDVVVGGVLQRNGSILALDVRIHSGDTDQADQVAIQALVRRIDNGTLIVGPYRVFLRAETNAQGDLSVGRWALVDGELVSDREILARKIVFLEEVAPAPFDLLDR